MANWLFITAHPTRLNVPTALITLFMFFSKISADGWLPLLGASGVF
jgi:hypothetical protein